MDRALGTNDYKAAINGFTPNEAFENTASPEVSSSQRGAGVHEDTFQMNTPLSGKFTRSMLALLIAAAATTAVAQDQPRRQGPPAASQQQQPAGEGVLRLLPADVVTEHSIMTASGKVDYTATAGTLSLFDQSGERSAAIF